MWGGGQFGDEWAVGMPAEGKGGITFWERHGHPFALQNAPRCARILLLPLPLSSIPTPVRVPLGYLTRLNPGAFSSPLMS